MQTTWGQAFGAVPRVVPRLGAAPLPQCQRCGVSGYTMCRACGADVCANCLPGHERDECGR